jgi:hypothetical protein
LRRIPTIEGVESSEDSSLGILLEKLFFFFKINQS